VNGTVPQSSLASSTAAISGALQQPRAAYLHVPFCRHRCGYCNFTVVAGRDDLIDRYLEALARELSWLVHPRPVDTLFLGGGTPTHLPLARLESLLTLAAEWFRFGASREFTIEANPIDVTPERVALLRQCGVNRLSIGAQSFHADKLRLLQRDHDARQIIHAVMLARDAMPSISLDLIFGVPGETLETWRTDLRQAIDMGVDHVSTYGLTIERGTQFWNRRHRGELIEIDEELWREMYATAIDLLTSAGFEHYEVSNFARRGHRCRHNEVYWAGEEYFAAGPGAARYVNGCRQVNHRSTTTWINRVLRGESPVAESESLGDEDRARERLVLGLRRLAGIDFDQFERDCGYRVDNLVGGALEKHLALGTLIVRDRRLRLSREGLFVSDAIWPDLLRR
jgi:oxygen-independent coproporphyrinogen-3 oxidase